jgi:RHH-type proline utilization regulon transcriptional repressor/proline dehydrogenase/delta 1-pyrroline-5-carboxylate dehydrogenase
MLQPFTLTAPTDIRAEINHCYRANEFDVMSERIKQATLPEAMNMRIREKAQQLVELVRLARQSSAGIDAFLTQYSLSSEEGIALMCLAEALLRVPDTATIDQLIKDKLSGANWEAHAGQSDSFFINATTWALMLTGKVLTPEKAESQLSKSLFTLVNRSGERVIRAAVEKAMRIMSKQFVMGRNIQEALKRAQKKEALGYRYSYDMLGEAAITQEDADRYFDAYLHSIESIGKSIQKPTSVFEHPGISIKLSALHPQYHEEKRERVLAELPPKLLKLAQTAKQYQIGLTIDAEESERLDLSLDVIERVFVDDSLEGWEGFGLAVQSYQKRAFFVLDWVAELARSKHRRMMVRLIKGAYWDSEIKKAQVLGLTDYPVFTRKVFTDVSFQACAKKIMSLTDAIYPQFATHNAYSVAMVLELVGDYRDFEFQCLHGMGAELYNEIVPANKLNIPCRIYAPVGSHEDLLPYLVRRLLENGANSSFVNRIVDENAPITSLIEDPVIQAGTMLSKINQNIPLPCSIFWPGRNNSSGLDLSDRKVLSQLQHDLQTFQSKQYEAKPLTPAFSQTSEHKEQTTFTPQHRKTAIGKVIQSTLKDVSHALEQASAANLTWSQTSVAERVQCLEKIALLFEQNKTELIYLLSQEAGKTIPDCIGEIRESIDFCRYYANQAMQILNKPMLLEGYTGERNTLSLHPRGTMLCISPWNFPLAIFTGQIVASLVTGNTVIAKPAEQTPLIAHFAVQLMHQAGIPKAVLHCLPGEGETIGAKLTEDKRIKGVLFTGSTHTANLIQLSLAQRKGEIVPFIAETGGLNAMIVDSSALLEQVVNDVIISAFGSAGQRCSALRVLYVQEDVYERCMHLLRGAMQELVLNDPAYLSTNVGPVIDEAALQALTKHVEKMSKKHHILYQTAPQKALKEGYFMPPTVIQIDAISALPEEIFGPVLHVIPFKLAKLDHVIEDINQTGYGLTFGIHSRIGSRVEYICNKLHVGNCYVNRNMIGAVVGLQPFGGEGLSGTGPKAGGPNYLQRLCVERTLTIDTTASGGNATLMSLD